MNYHLAQGCENTFILIDRLHQTHLNTHDMVKEHEWLLHTQRDDALILTQLDQTEDTMLLQMHVLGQDGNWGEFCGNGARACAAYLFTFYPQFKRFFLKTSYGEHELLSDGKGGYSVFLPWPRHSVHDEFFTEQGKWCASLGLRYVRMLEPHLIVPCFLSDEELVALGRSLNALKEIFPHGINVNSSYWQGDLLFVRTYERGVQRLTRSCGTGSVASAFALHPYEDLSVMTPGGPLEILYREEGIELKGPALLETQR